jgi:hypothetical protein
VKLEGQDSTAVLSYLNSATNHFIHSIWGLRYLLLYFFINFRELYNTTRHPLLAFQQTSSSFPSTTSAHNSTTSIS